MPVTNDELHTRFTYHPVKEGQAEVYQRVRQKARELAELVLHVCPDSREQATALTKIEEACFWINAGIARRT
jgi:hypothetical protein